MKKVENHPHSRAEKWAVESFSANELVVDRRIELGLLLYFQNALQFIINAIKLWTIYHMVPWNVVDYVYDFQCYMPFGNIQSF